MRAVGAGDLEDGHLGGGRTERAHAQHCGDGLQLAHICVRGGGGWEVEGGGRGLEAGLVEADHVAREGAKGGKAGGAPREKARGPGRGERAVFR